MTYTVQLEFSIDEDDAMTDKEVKDTLWEIFDCYNCHVENIKVIYVDD